MSLKSSQVPEAFGSGPLSRSPFTITTTLGFSVGTASRFQLTWDEVPSDRVPKQVLSVKGLRLEMCPLVQMCFLSLTDADQETELVLCSISLFTKANWCWCMCGIPKIQSLWCSSRLPFSSGTIQERVCEWVWEAYGPNAPLEECGRARCEVDLPWVKDSQPRVTAHIGEEWLSNWTLDL